MISNTNTKSKKNFNSPLSQPRVDSTKKRPYKNKALAFELRIAGSMKKINYILVLNIVRTIRQLGGLIVLSSYHPV